MTEQNNAYYLGLDDRLNVMACCGELNGFLLRGERKNGMTQEVNTTFVMSLMPSGGYIELTWLVKQVCSVFLETSRHFYDFYKRFIGVSITDTHTCPISSQTQITTSSTLRCQIQVNSSLQLKNFLIYSQGNSIKLFVK